MEVMSAWMSSSRRLHTSQWSWPDENELAAEPVASTLTFGPSLICCLPSILLIMGDVQKWLSVKVQRALGLESPAEGAAIVDQIRAKTDPREIEATIKVCTVFLTIEICSRRKLYA